MESEYIALFEASRNAVFLTGLAIQLGITHYNPDVWCDNKAAIAIATGDGLPTGGASER